MHTHTQNTHTNKYTYKQIHTLVIPDGKKKYGQEAVLKERWPKFTETGKKDTSSEI